MQQNQSTQSPRAAQDLVVLAASLGGLEALQVICRALPADFPAAIAIVLHRLPTHAGLLAQVLSRSTALPVVDVREGELLVPGTVYIAPADLHMTITSEATVALIDGGPIHHVLSSADPLFASAAVAFGSRLTAVVLTGGDGDGAAGVRSVKLEGGTVFAQDPNTAVCGDMPRKAIATGMVDAVLALDAIAPALTARVCDDLGIGLERPVGTS